MNIMTISWDITAPHNQVYVYVKYRNEPEELVYRSDSSTLPCRVVIGDRDPDPKYWKVRVEHLTATSDGMPIGTSSNISAINLKPSLQDIAPEEMHSGAMIPLQLKRNHPDIEVDVNVLSTGDSIGTTNDEQSGEINALSLGSTFGGRFVLRETNPAPHQFSHSYIAHDFIFGALNSNLVEMSFTVGDGDILYVDWGDGTTDEYTAGDVICSHQYTGSVDGILIKAYFIYRYDMSLHGLRGIGAILRWTGSRDGGGLFRVGDFAGGQSELTTVPSTLPVGVSDFSEFLKGCHMFNSPVILNWDMGQVVNARSMFQGCVSLDQDLSQWDVHRIENMDLMFGGVPLLPGDLSQWCVPNIYEPPESFVGWDYDTTDPKLPVWGTCPRGEKENSQWDY